MFGPGGSVLVSDVHCTGSEQQIHLCNITGNSNDGCSRKHSAGVVCSRNFGTFCGNLKFFVFEK